MIYQLRQEYLIQAMCVFFRVSRAGYYAWVHRMDRTDADQERMQVIEQAYERSHRTYGYRRVALWIRRERGLQMNPKAVLRLMRKMGIRSIARRRKVWQRVETSPRYHRYANRLNRDFTATQPNQKWVTDVTWIQTRQGTMYLSVIKDLYDGFVVSYAVSPQNSVELVTTTLHRAQQIHPNARRVTLHSDQGHQYCSQAYFLMTRQAQIDPSMSRVGIAGTMLQWKIFFGHLKAEAIDPLKPETIQQAKEVIDDYIYFCNYERIQLKTKLTPYELRCQSV